MCGIFAYAGFEVKLTIRQLITLLVNGLKRLEYRGYDSAGICVDRADGTSCIIRKEGNVDVLRNAALNDNEANLNMDEVLTAASGISHTRWATHGPPSDKNAHPQSSSPSDDFIVVHNGIMTNFAETKLFLEGKGFSFRSDTDTEVVAALTKFLYDKHQGKISFVQLVAEVMTLTNGACALAFKSKHYPGELVACRRGSPLIVGVKRAGETSSSSIASAGSFASDGGPKSPGPSSAVAKLGSIGSGPCEIFIASDAAPIVEHTRHVMYLEDDDIVGFKDGRLQIFSRSNVNDSLQEEDRQISELEMQLEALSRGQYEHFMQKEIFEQSESIINSMRGRLNMSTGQVVMGGFTGQNRRTMLYARRLIFIACGTSMNACVAVRPLFDELAPSPTSVENASDFLDRRPKIFRDDVCIFVSQSGETADTLRALEYCRDNGAVLVGFTNTVGSSISRMTHFGAHLNAGPEIGVASTKAFTSQIVTMTLLALMLCEDSKQLEGRRREIIQGLMSLSASVSSCLGSNSEPMQRLAKTMTDSKSILVVARGYQYALCLEAALKIKELTYIHTEGINAGELKHGPLALIDSKLTVIIVCTKDSSVDRARSAVQQIRARDGRPVIMLSHEDPEMESLAEEVIRVPSTVDCLQSVVNVIPMQLLAYHLALSRGNNVDCPRNLAKSVTTQ